MSDNSYQYHTVVLVTIIISRHIDRGISNWSVDLPAVRIVRNRGPYRPGRFGHGPYRLDTDSELLCSRSYYGWPRGGRFRDGG